MGQGNADAALQHPLNALHIFPHWHAPYTGIDPKAVDTLHM